MHTNASTTIEVRDVHFELDAADSEIPSAWHGEGLAISRFFDTLSLFFPAGERFFIAAVKAFAPQLEDPTLRQQVKEFCAQEGMHSREHVSYNRMLKRFGYAAEWIEQKVVDHLRWVSKSIGPRRRLAVTCALEHFTAVISHLLLSHPEILRRAHPKMAALWHWHAVEENEHKAVAFDVYQATGGGYWLRTSAMVSATIIFLAKVIRYQFLLVPGQSFRSSLRQIIESNRFMFSHVSVRELWQLYAAYYRPSFHPWQVDNRALIQTRSSELAESGYTT